MRKNLKITGLFLAAMLCISAFVMMPAAATPNMQGTDERQFQGPFGMLDDLDEQGFDTTAVRAAIESGDHDAVRELMKALMDEAGIERGSCPDAENASEGPGLMNGAGPEKMLDNLDEQGFDTTAVRAAIESGDHDTAKELMKALMDEAGIERGDLGNRGGAGAGPEDMLDSLDEQGYDTSAVRAAIESGDHDIARELMKTLMDEAGIQAENKENGFQKNRMRGN